jgi:hypothetical protein
MCKHCGDPDCKRDKFSSVPDDPFSEFMLLTAGDIMIKMVRQIVLGDLLRSGLSFEEAKNTMEQSEGLEPTDLGPKMLYIVYEASLHAWKKMSKDPAFNKHITKVTWAKKFKWIFKLFNIAQPHVLERDEFAPVFWDAISEYMESQGFIARATSANIEALTNQQIVNSGLNDFIEDNILKFGEKKGKGEPPVN